MCIFSLASVFLLASISSRHKYVDFLRLYPHHQLKRGTGSNIDCCLAEIAACYGSDMTEHAANHRFRHIKAQSEIIIAGRKANLDMKHLTADETVLPKAVGAVDKNSTLIWLCFPWSLSWLFFEETKRLLATYICPLFAFIFFLFNPGRC